MRRCIPAVFASLAAAAAIETVKSDALGSGDELDNDRDGDITSTAIASAMTTTRISSIPTSRPSYATRITTRGGGGNGEGTAADPKNTCNGVIDPVECNGVDTAQCHQLHDESSKLCPALCDACPAHDGIALHGSGEGEGDGREDDDRVSTIAFDLSTDQPPRPGNNTDRDDGTDESGGDGDDSGISLFTIIAIVAGATLLNVILGVLLCGRRSGSANTRRGSLDDPMLLQEIGMMHPGRSPFPARFTFFHLSAALNRKWRVHHHSTKLDPPPWRALLL